MVRGAVALISLASLVTAIPNRLLEARDDVNEDAPWESDPKDAPKDINFPAKAENPYPDGIPTQPDQCDGQNPSEECFNTMGGSGGYLWFDKDSQCDEGQKSTMQTAVWDATTLASYASNFPDSGEANRGRASGRFYMGPDYPSQQGRIAGNLKRAWQFKTSTTSEKEYITMSCKDTKALCGKKWDGKSVGGYAWTYSGWFYYYHYITFCPPFFTLDTMDTKINDIEQDLARGDTHTAKDMTWLRTTGLFFLHELMHTRLADGGVEPHIIDEYVAPIPEGEKPGTNDVKAYGPRLVHNLARRSLNQGGGATRSSTNADSYSMLANSIWWWDTTGYFPGVPGRSDPTLQASQSSADDFLVSLHLDLNNDTNPAEADFSALYDTELSTFGEGPADEPDPPTSSTAPEPASSSEPAPPPEPTCPVSNDEHWPTCDECPGGWDENTCIASEASAACACKAPCGNTNCVM